MQDEKYTHTWHKIDCHIHICVFCYVLMQYMADAIGLSRIFIKNVFSLWKFLIFFIYTKKMVAFTGKHNVLYLVGKRME